MIDPGFWPIFVGVGIFAVSTWWSWATSAGKNPPEGLCMLALLILSVLFGSLSETKPLYIVCIYAVLLNIIGHVTGAMLFYLSRPYKEGR